jgi:hypothetical protein
MDEERAILHLILSGSVIILKQFDRFFLKTTCVLLTENLSAILPKTGAFAVVAKTDIRSLFVCFLNELFLSD